MKERLVTAGIGLFILVIWLFFFETIALNIVLAMLGVLIVYELLSATKCMENTFLLIVSFVYALAIPILTFPVPGIDFSMIRNGVTFGYLIIVFLVYLFTHKTMRFEQLSFSVFVSIAVPLSLSYAMQIRDQYPMDGVFIFLLSLGGAWLTDSCSYFVGTFLGKHKLAPEISPKKTLEGFFGGIIGCVIFSVLLVFGYSCLCDLKGAVMEVSYWQAALFGLTAAFVSVLGDLSASLIKRQCAVKDFGNIMPGHGGAMDRFDSVLFVLPYAFFFMQIFPILVRV